MTLLTFNSYGFNFNAERGNYDIYVQFFILLGVWSLIARPRNIWLPVLLFSMATHLKIYPAIMLVAVVWKFRYKSLLPILIVNMGLLFVTGIPYAESFIEVIINYTRQPYLWVGNHSAASFAALVNGVLAEHVNWSIPGWVFVGLPVLLWGMGTVALICRGFNVRNLLWFYVLSVPMMNLLPPVSHDYKLVLLMAPLSIVWYFLLANLDRPYSRQQVLAWIGIGALLVLVVFLTRSYAMLPVLLGNKYPFILSMQGIFLSCMLSLTRKNTKTNSDPISENVSVNKVEPVI